MRGFNFSRMGPSTDLRENEAEEWVPGRPGPRRSALIDINWQRSSWRNLSQVRYESHSHFPLVAWLS